MNKYLIAALLMFSAAGESMAKNPWSLQTQPDKSVSGIRYIKPQRALYYSLDPTVLESQLRQAPTEEDYRHGEQSYTIELPVPEGGFEKFKIASSPVMEAGLMNKYPGITTYIAQGIDRPSLHGRLDFTYKGFHAMLIGKEGTIFIDPLTLDTKTAYQVYYKHDYINTDKTFICGNTEEQFIPEKSLASGLSSIGETLRTYRLALATTFEYSSFSGGTVSSVLSAMVTSINRVTGVYESELAVRLVLIANTDTLIFLTSSDPYTNNNGATMLNQNQTTVNARIGSANYDIGHVFSTGGGGIAQYACVCSNSSKARGVTGSGSPVGDPYDIDYVAHEMGHQFSGSHTFNSTIGSCGGGNRSANTAWEPGSGVTIMAYAGICGSDDVASNSIAYFHTGSFDEMNNFITNGNGNNCASQTATGNTAPVIAPFPTSYAAPYLCGLILNGTATDANNDVLSYSWEQVDVGPAGAWNAPTGNAPLFRSYPPVDNGTRYCPRIVNVMNNTSPIGEWKPNYARTLKFKLTARDNRAGGAGVVNTPTPLTVQIVNTPDTFKVTYPNSTGISWQGLSSQTITWKVANTTAAPINCQAVDIFLSTNNGASFPVQLAGNVPNTGSYVIAVPNTPSTSCRIMIVGNGNIFFDVNDRNFTITSNPAGITSLNCAGATVNGQLVANQSTSGVVLSIPYTGGQSGSFAAQSISSTGVTGLSAACPAGNFANGSGSLSLGVFGIPSGMGDANFLIAIGGQSCTVTIPITTAAGFSRINTDTELKIYPNPNSGSFVLEFENPFSGSVNIEIFDVLGQSVFQTEMQKNGRRVAMPLQVANLSKGNYILRVSHKEFASYRKFIKD
ncbi:MAG: reprolysin-like metallopeptidase [Bacteroidota bacterium]|jgi:hypothetical protein